MRGELYLYKGKMMSQADIAKLEGINRSTLADWYKKTGNMMDSVAKAKESHAQRNIEYKGDVLSLKAISVKEKIKFETLKKNWLNAGKNIYTAVKITKDSQAMRNGNIQFRGEMLSMSKISKLTELDRHALSRYFEKTNDIEESIKLAQAAKTKKNGTIEYKGKLRTISGISELECIKRETLKEYFDLYGNIEKAVFMTKVGQNKRKQALLRGKKASYEELSKFFGISTIKLEKMIESGYSPEQIEKKIKTGIKKERQLKIDEDSLYKYCLDNSYNYWVINNLIKVYGKDPKEAIKIYLGSGQRTPTKWIYEKYDVLFKHLMLNFGIDSNRIIKIMKDNDFGIEQALEEFIFITGNDNKYKLAEISWLKECYSFLREVSPEKLVEAKKTLYIDDREMEFLLEKGSKIELIKRQLLLFEFSQIIDDWSEEELSEMMDLYDLNDKEKQSIILDLYCPYKNQVINPTTEYIKRQELIKNKIIDNTVEISNLTNLEKKEIQNKRSKLIKIFSKRNKENGDNIDIKR